MVKPLLFENFGIRIRQSKIKKKNLNLITDFIYNFEL